jgi:hypothetical protein
MCCLSANGYGVLLLFSIKYVLFSAWYCKPNSINGRQTGVNQLIRKLPEDDVRYPLSFLPGMDQLVFTDHGGFTGILSLAP